MSNREIISLHIVIIIVISLSTKILASYILGNNFTPVTWEYEQLAQKMLTEGRYEMEYREYGSYKALLAPAYSFMCYGIYKITGTNHITILAVQFILMTLFSVSIYFMAMFFFNKTDIAFIAGFLSALHPGLIYYSSVYLHKITLYIPLFYLSILLLCIAFRKQKTIYFVLLGISSGLAVLSRATFASVFILGIFYYLVFGTNSLLKKRVTLSAIAVLIFFALNLPWIRRNYLLFDKFIFSQNNKWEAFWVGNNPNASGGHFHPDGSAVLSCKPIKMQAEIIANKNNEIAIEEIFRNNAIEYVRSQPVSFIKGLIRKAFYFWWFYPQTGLFYPRLFLFAYKALYCILLVLTGYGIYICQKEKLWQREMIFPVLLVIGIWATHTINFMEMRHRWTVEPVLIIFASLSIKSILNKFRNAIR